MQGGRGAAAAAGLYALMWDDSPRYTKCKTARHRECVRICYYLRFKKKMVVCVCVCARLYSETDSGTIHKKVLIVVAYRKKMDF